MRKLIIIPALCFSIVALGGCEQDRDTTPVDTTQSPTRTEPAPTVTPRQPATTTQTPATTAQQPGTTTSPSMANQTHTGNGTITQIEVDRNQVTVEHDPIASLNWPAMTMTFDVDDASQLQALEQGDRVSFDFVQAGENRYVIQRIEEGEASQLSQQDDD